MIHDEIKGINSLDFVHRHVQPGLNPVSPFHHINRFIEHAVRIADTALGQQGECVDDHNRRMLGLQHLLQHIIRRFHRLTGRSHDITVQTCFRIIDTRIKGILYMARTKGQDIDAVVVQIPEHISVIIVIHPEIRGQHEPDTHEKRACQDALQQDLHNVGSLLVFHHQKVM